MQAAGIHVRADELQRLQLRDLEPAKEGSPDVAARASCEELVRSVMSAPEGGPLVVECVTCADADRVLAAAIGCSHGSIATTPGGITCMTFDRQDGRLKEVSSLNHCGHL